MAVSSAVLDRETASLYAEAGVKEYWIVFGTTRQIEVYRRPEGGRYLEVVLVSPEDAIDCGSTPGIRLKVADLFP